MAHSTYSLFALLFPLTAIAACSGKVELGNYPGDDSGVHSPESDSGVVFSDGGVDASSSVDSGVHVPPGALCSIPGGPEHAYTSIADVQNALAGRWLRCAGDIYSPANTAGIEFAGDKAYFLIHGPNDTVVRGAGFDYERSVVIRDLTSFNGPGSYQIDLDTGSGHNSYFSDYSGSPRKLRLNENTSGKIADYAAEVSPTNGCIGTNPQGCMGTSCPSGETCVVGNSTCAPTACSCDGPTKTWVCTADCSGGACVADVHDGGTADH